MKRHHQSLFLVILLAICANGIGKAEPATGEDSISFVSARIAALNKVPTALSSNVASRRVEIELPGGEKKKAIRIKEELSRRGVSIRMKHGRYVDVSKEVANGHALDPEDMERVAVMNHLHQEYCSSQDPRRLPDGSAVALRDALMSELDRRGISLKLKGDLFIVDSVRTPPTGHNSSAP